MNPFTEIASRYEENELVAADTELGKLERLALKTCKLPYEFETLKIYTLWNIVDLYQNPELPQSALLQELHMTLVEINELINQYANDSLEQAIDYTDYDWPALEYVPDADFHQMFQSGRIQNVSGQPLTEDDFTG